ncbi:hypothetical protein Aspvir_005680 [Aspergillus viridinutans]|uniref:Uncharacterized protein n=1 Tax=Aspergillus viridinutans TaxID=75553 RepID=A0A9P3BTE0_ASPVI|nr:uncharacterized protein Aspvir_005680 [Aspergillus viridinutans]GIK01642.1 hypothetical protein Aspvir_005680 [Aspergillus viridinutans]
MFGVPPKDDEETLFDLVFNQDIDRPSTLEGVLAPNFIHITPSLSSLDLKSASSHALVSTHFLQLTQRATNTADASLLQNYDRVLAMIRRIRATVDSNVDVHVSRSGGDGVSASSNGASIRGLGPHLFRLRSDVRLPKGEESPNPQCTVKICGGSELELTATGTVTSEVDARWPVYLCQLQGTDKDTLLEMGFWHVAWLIISSGTITEEQLQRSQHWDVIGGKVESPASLVPGEKYAGCWAKR